MAKKDKLEEIYYEAALAFTTCKLIAGLVSAYSDRRSDSKELKQASSELRSCQEVSTANISRLLLDARELVKDKPNAEERLKELYTFVRFYFGPSGMSSTSEKAFHAAMRARIEAIRTEMIW